MDLLRFLHARYATKKFDKSKKVSLEDINQIKEILQFSASSTNIQPWHFLIISSDEGKERLIKSTKEHYGFNDHKIADSSFSIVFAAKNEISDEYLSHITEKEKADGRFPTDQQMQDTHNGRKFFVDLHKNANDLQAWMNCQTYLNLGSLMFALAVKGIDSVAMEGFDRNVLDQEFKLIEKGFTSLVILSVGYNLADDFNANLPKSRLSLSEIIEEI